MLLSVLVGALVFSNFVNVADLPAAMADAVASTSMFKYAIIVIIILFYMVLGCSFDTLAIILLTIPVFFRGGFDPAGSVF